MIHDYELNDVIEMKKPHPCKKSTTWHIIRIGADMKIKCDGCGAVIEMPRYTFERKAKRVVQKAQEQV